MASVAVTRVLRALDSHATREIGRLTRTIHFQLQLVNPVATGHSRANWIVSHGAPHLGVVGSPKAVDTESAPASLAAVLALPSLLHAPTFLVNSVDYIGKLNDGSSNQAPAGFVQRAVLVGVVTL